MTVTISDMMRKTLETIQDMASVQDAAKKMKEKGVSSLVVVDADGKPEGLITEQDLVRKVCVSDKPVSAVTNKEIMSSSPLVTIKASSSISAAADDDKEAIQKVLQKYMASEADMSPSSSVFFEDGLE
jgi:signal-transduction protein with cAMP-binding, CBS, and nucleotidyltransferase domain